MNNAVVTEIFQVFLYLLSMIIIYYNDFTLIYDEYYTSSSISLSYSQNIVSEQYALVHMVRLLCLTSHANMSVFDVGHLACGRASEVTRDADELGFSTHMVNLLCITSHAKRVTRCIAERLT